MNSNIELSFCIPTYNNAKSLNRLVLSILEIGDRDIEVVVLDNGSTDETLTLLNTIEDSRLSTYSNEINKGALFNMMNVLDKANGKYMVYCTDHDHIDIKKINRFKNYLINNPNIGFGYCIYNSNTQDKIEVYNSGFDALDNLSYITRHPTGYFFKREFWKSIESVKRFSDYEYVDLFPLEFVFAELSLLGDGVKYHDSVFRPETGERVVKHKSSTTKGNMKTAFFSPECRLKLAINFKDHIQSLNISEKEKNKLIINSFYRELLEATVGYKFVVGNHKLCIHYRMQEKKLSKIELLQIGMFFFNEYFQKSFDTRKYKFFKKIKLGFLLFTKPIKISTFFYRILLK